MAERQDIYLLEKGENTEDLSASESEIEDDCQDLWDHKRQSHYNKLCELQLKMANVSTAIETHDNAFLSYIRFRELSDREVMKKANKVIANFDDDLKDVNRTIIDTFEIVYGQRRPSESVQLVLDNAKTLELEEHFLDVIAELEIKGHVKYFTIKARGGFIYVYSARTSQEVQNPHAVIDYNQLRKHEKYGFFIVVKILEKIHMLKFKFLEDSLLVRQTASLFVGETGFCYKNVLIRNTPASLVIPSYKDESDCVIGSDDIIPGICDNDGIIWVGDKIGVVFSLREAGVGAQLHISTVKCETLLNCIAVLVAQEDERAIRKFDSDSCHIIDCGIILNPVEDV